MSEKENRNQKNSVFVDLFYEDESAEENEIALYNALHEEPLPEGTQIQKIRVENVIYMNLKNDVSFGVDGKLLMFGEHQSTVNENMPLRSLLYVGRAYEQLVPVESRYKKKQIKIPRPEFYTFYNGTEKWAKEKILKLSDAYLSPSDQVMLDLSVRVININPQEQHEILKKCKVLKEYSEFNDAIRKYQSQNIEEPYKYAIEECIRHGILADYLRKKGSEVINMLTAEYDYNLDIRVQREEAKEEGKIEGKIEGKLEGKLEGKIEEKIEDILEILKSKGEISPDLEQYIREQTDINVLKMMFHEAVCAQTIEKFMERHSKCG